MATTQAAPTPRASRPAAVAGSAAPTTTDTSTPAQGEGTHVEARPSTAAGATAQAEPVSVPELLARGRTLCTPPLRAAVARLAPPMDAVAAYHFGWTDQAGNPTASDGGKAIRPALALLSAEAAGAEAPAGVPGGVAVELVHNFSLLHDDLMDGDETRRHRATAWTVFGPAQAILVGDALATLGTEVLLDAGQGAATPADAARAVRLLTTATRKLIDGQAQDLSFEHRDAVTVEECLAMEGGKTGALLAAASAIGAVLAGADDRTADALERYGHHLGLAFQAVDDLLGIWGATEVTGKPHWGDLRQRKKSLPVAAALAEGGAASRRLAELLADPQGRGEESEEVLAGRAALIEQAGGRAWTQEEARRQHTTALAALDEVPMADEVRERFVALAEFVVVRER
ncbi:polyprenyl synthetase family protein [Kitasatospora sp. NBC_01250]|uniref:polyprenyl synthetase family protein n=1 Tax=unclassified Kitasatospora TaxID=2633591 RepID=UPI002E0E2A37|nr:MULTISPECIES: polyprenyl synthetase family protein [unclassified Kitasatospora]WSJ70439.1 polyprenyl synthetase family protein [Kitasatospora sp. NBC_01302]